MSFEDNIKPLITEISRDLESDLELQLDVEMELECHLLESYENCLERGLNEEESEEHALKEFGDIIDIKEKIVSGNLKRMNSRARVKTILWYTFIPLCIVLALFLGAREVIDIYKFAEDIGKNSLAQSKEAHLIKLKELEQNFDTELYSELSQSMPNNAYLDSLLIADKTKDSIDFKEVKVIDEQLFQQLLDDVRVMVSKSEFNSFKQEKLLAVEQAYKSGLPRMLSSIVHKITFIDPGLYSLLKIGKVILKRGNIGEVKLLHETLVHRITYSTNYYEIIGLGFLSKKYLENRDLVNNVKKQFPESHDFFTKVFEVSSEYSVSGKQKLKENELMKNQKAGIMAKWTLPYLSSKRIQITDEMLSPSRKLEHCYIERLFCMLIITFNLIALGLGLLFMFGTKFFKKTKKLFILLSIKDWLRHILCTIILPIVLYQLYKKLPFASINYNLKEAFISSLLEIIILALTVTIFSSFVLYRKYYNRMEMLGIKEELNVSKSTFVQATITTLLILLLMFFLLKESKMEIFSVISKHYFSYFYSHRILRSIDSDKLIYIDLFLVILAATFVIISIKFLLWHFSFDFKKTLSAQRCILSGMILNLSLTILILTVYSTIYLRAQESYYYSQDSLFKYDVNSNSLLENKIVKDMKEEVLKVSEN